MVNYQLYRTNVLLGGQMKYDLILEPTQRGNETGIVDFHITPISKHVPYGKHIQEDLLNYSHNENIKKYYEKISSSFYKDFTNPLLTSNYPLPTGYKGEISETTYEMGCRRMTYSLYQKQHEFLCPVWLEKIDDINKLEFEFQVTVNSKSTTPIYIRKVKFDSNPKLATYFNEYINMLGLKGNGEDWVFNISQNGCQANGLNVKTGLCSVVQLPNLFNNLSSRERPLLEFNNIIINKLNEKHLITKQLFNFNLCFNFDDIMNAYIYNELHMHPIYINVVVKYDGKALDVKDIFSNHEFINKPYLHLPELEFSNPDKIIVKSTPSNENLLDYLKDDKCLGLIDKNKITQNTCHWGYCSGSGSHFNFYDGFSSVFKSPNGQKIYIPGYNENVCDINYDGSNLDTNNITSIGYPYWCNTYKFMWPNQSNEEAIKNEIYTNLQSLFSDESQTIWSTFTPGCIQKGVQYLGGDGCVDVLSLYTFPQSETQIRQEALGYIKEFKDLFEFEILDGEGGLKTMYAIGTPINPEEENIYKLSKIEYGLGTYDEKFEDLISWSENDKWELQPLSLFFNSSETYKYYVDVDQVPLVNISELRGCLDLLYQNNNFLVDDDWGFDTYEMTIRNFVDNSESDFDIIESFTSIGASLYLWENGDNNIVNSIKTGAANILGLPLQSFISSLDSALKEFNTTFELGTALFELDGDITYGLGWTTNEYLGFTGNSYGSEVQYLEIGTTFFKHPYAFTMYQDGCSLNYVNSVLQSFKTSYKNVVYISKVLRTLYELCKGASNPYYPDWISQGDYEKIKNEYNKIIQYQKDQSYKDINNICDTLFGFGKISQFEKEGFKQRTSRIKHELDIVNEKINNNNIVIDTINEKSTIISSVCSSPMGGENLTEILDSLDTLNDVVSPIMGFDVMSQETFNDYKNNTNELFELFNNKGELLEIYEEFYKQAKTKSEGGVDKNIKIGENFATFDTSGFYTPDQDNSFVNIVKLLFGQSGISYSGIIKNNYIEKIIKKDADDSIIGVNDVLNHYLLRAVINYFNTLIYPGGVYQITLPYTIEYDNANSSDPTKRYYINKRSNANYPYLQGMVEYHRSLYNWFHFIVQESMNSPIGGGANGLLCKLTGIANIHSATGLNSLNSRITTDDVISRNNKLIFIKAALKMLVNWWKGLEKAVKSCQKNDSLSFIYSNIIQPCRTIYIAERTHLLKSPNVFSSGHGLHLSAHCFLTKLLEPYFKYKVWINFLTHYKQQKNIILDRLNLLYDYPGKQHFINEYKNKYGIGQSPSDFDIFFLNFAQQIHLNEVNKNEITGSYPDGVNNILSEQSCYKRENLKYSSPIGVEDLFKEILNKFKKDYRGIYTLDITNIDAIDPSTGAPTKTSKTYVVYKKDKDEVDKILFWNLFKNISDQSLPFSKHMLFPNITKTMGSYRDVFGSTNTSGLLSILNSANKEFQQLLPFRNGLTYKTANGPSLSVKEIDYYKAVLSRQVSVFRELGKIKPYFIDQQSINENFVYSKKTVKDMGPDYKKYVLTNLPPKYPSIGYFALQHSPVVYQKVDDGTKNEYNLYISNKIINLETEFDINYSTSDAISFDVHKHVEDYIKNKYKYVLGEKPSEDNIKEITSKYKIEHTHIDSEIVDNEYRTVYKLKIKLK